MCVQAANNPPPTAYSAHILHTTHQDKHSNAHNGIIGRENFEFFGYEPEIKIRKRERVRQTHRYHRPIDTYCILAFFFCSLAAAAHAIDMISRNS